MAQKELLENVGVRAFDVLQRKFQTRDIARAERLGEKLASIVHRVDKKHRRRTDSNLAMAFPEWSAEKRAETAKEMYRHFGRVFADFMRTPSRSNADVLSSTEVVGIEHFRDALDQDKGIIAITGHFGNWERMCQWMSASGHHLTVIARDANQGGLNERVLAIRQAAGVEVLSRGNAARGALTKLRKKEMVGILPDQNAGELFIPFFGKPCGTVKGPGVFYERTEAPVLPTFCVWLAPGRYRVEFLPILKPEAGFEVAEGMMRSINAALETMIRRYPAQWLWMHDRWKSARQRGQL